MAVEPIGNVSSAEALDHLRIELIDASTDEVIWVLKLGEAIPASVLDGISRDTLTLSVIAMDEGGLAGTIGSVMLKHTELGETRTENASPYALFGDAGGDFQPGGLPSGTNTVELSVFSGPGAGGDLLLSTRIIFELPEHTATDAETPGDLGSDITPQPIFDPESASDMPEPDGDQTTPGGLLKIRDGEGDVWAGGFNGEIHLTNEGGALGAWTARIALDVDRVTAIWGAEIISFENGILEVQGADWNSSIGAGETVWFGLSVSGNPDAAFSVLDAPAAPHDGGGSEPESEPDAQTTVSGQLLVREGEVWGGGFNGEIHLSNQGDTIENWTATFTLSGGSITEIWGAEIISQENGAYQVRAADWNGTLEGGESAWFGVTIAGSRDTVLEVTGLNAGGPPQEEQGDPSPSDDMTDDGVTEDPAPEEDGHSGPADMHHLPDVPDLEPGSPFIDWTLDETRLMEQQMTLMMVPSDAMSHVAVRDGAWSDPSTWQNGEVPGAGARVQIRQGVEVLYDIESDAHVHSLRVDGGLSFTPDQDTRLVVDTFVVTHSGTLTMGTEENPIGGETTADIVFKDHPDAMMDGMKMGLGLVSLGTVDIHGEEKTSHVKVLADPMKGDTSLTLAEVPVNWEIGDRIVLTGTKAFDTEMRDLQDEVRTISGIEGHTVYLNEPLVHDHDTPGDGFKAYAANMTRSITFASDNPDVIAERGHVMFMHNDDVDVRYAAFDELGRTDKSRLDVGSDDNPNGRYSFHFHKMDLEIDNSPALAVGNTVFGSPGWGFVHHSAYAVMTDNAAYGVDGAAFVAESGDETGVWSRNIAIGGIGIEGNADRPKAAVGTANNGNGGVGYYFQGRLVHNHDNVAASQSSHGFLYFHRGTETSEDVKSGTFDDPFGETYQTRDGALSQDRPAIQNFSDNEAFAVNAGLEVIKNQPDQHHGQRTVIDGFTAWNVQNGMHLQYTGHYLVRDVIAVSRKATGIHSGSNKEWSSSGIVTGNRLTDVTFDNIYTEGFHDGFKATGNLSAPDDGTILTRYESVGNINRVTDSADNPDFFKEVPNNQIVIDPDGRPQLVFDGTADLSISGTGGQEYIRLNGILTDSLGSTDYLTVDGHADRRAYFHVDIPTLVEDSGIFTLPDGKQAVLFSETVADRWSGKAYLMDIPIILQGDGLQKHGTDQGTLDAVSENGHWYTNSAPYAVTDTINLDESKTVVFSVLDNDTDLDGDAVTLFAYSEVGSGVLDYLGDGLFRYTPEDGIVTREVFSYFVTDADGSGRAREGRAYLNIGEVTQEDTAPPADLLYKMDGTAPGSLTDGSLNGLDAVIEGAARSGATGDGSPGALVFDGIDDIVTIPDTPLVNLQETTNRTVILDFKAEDLSGTDPQILYQEGCEMFGLNIYLSDGRLFVGAWSDVDETFGDGADWTGGWDGTFLDLGRVEEGQWTSVALVLDDHTSQGHAGRGQAGLYGFVDGDLIAFGTAQTLQPHEGDVTIGAGRDNTELHDGNDLDPRFPSDTGNVIEPDGEEFGFFQGSIDALRIYNKALSETQIEVAMGTQGDFSLADTLDRTTLVEADGTLVTAQSPDVVAFSGAGPDPLDSDDLIFVSESPQGFDAVSG